MPLAQMKPRRGTFDVATAGGGREPRTGYVLGDWGTTKSRWFWEFTHLPTGVKVNTYPVMPEKKADALAHLERLHAEGPNERDRATLARGTWGLL